MKSSESILHRVYGSETANDGRAVKMALREANLAEKRRGFWGFIFSFFSF